MKHKAMFLCLVFLLALALNGHKTFAQDRENCSTIPESIYDLAQPQFSGSIKWRRLVGTDAFENALAIFQHKKETQLLLLSQSGAETPVLRATQISSKGRLLKETDIPLKDAASRQNAINGAFEVGDTIAVPYSTKNGVGKIVFIDRDARVLNAQSITVKGYDVTIRKILPQGEGYIVLASATSKRQPSDTYTVLAMYKAPNKKIWKRSFLPGTYNILHDIIANETGGYYAVGEVIASSRRKTGIFVEFDDKGALLNQEILPRGKEASLVKMRYDGANQIIVAGNIKPHDNTAQASWLGSILPNGKFKWQVYLREENEQLSKDIDFLPNGMPILSVQSHPPKNRKAGRQNRAYARLIALRSNGLVHDSLPIIEGDGLVVTGLHQIEDDFYVYGRVKMKIQLPEASENNTKKEHIYNSDSWIAQISKLKQAENPCYGQ